MKRNDHKDVGSVRAPARDSEAASPSGKQVQRRVLGEAGPGLESITEEVRDQQSRQATEKNACSLSPPTLPLSAKSKWHLQAQETR